MKNPKVEIILIDMAIYLYAKCELLTQLIQGRSSNPYISTYEYS